MPPDKVGLPVLLVTTDFQQEEQPYEENRYTIYKYFEYGMTVLSVRLPSLIRQPHEARR